jgi:MFS family permease
MNAPDDPRLADPRLSAGLSAPEPGQWYPRPLTFGQILDRVYRLLRGNFRLFVTIGMIPLAAIVLFEAVSLALIFGIVNPYHPERSSHPSPESFAAVMVVFIVCWLGLIAVYALFEAVAICAALNVDAGIPVTVLDAWRQIRGKAGRYLWLALLRMLVALVPIFSLGLLCLGGLAVAMALGKGEAHPGALFLLLPFWMLLLLCTCVYALLVVLWLALAYPASIVEQLPAWRAIRRSVELTRGVRGRLFLALLVIYALCYAGLMGVELVALALFSAGSLAMVALHLAAVYGYIGIGVAVAVFVPVLLVVMAVMSVSFSIVFAVIYRDQRRMEEMRAALAPPAV